MPSTGGVLGTSRRSLLERRIEPRCRLGSSLGNVMRNDIQPLAVPTQNTTPHLKVLESGDLALETTSDGTQDDAHIALDWLIGLWVQDELGLCVVGECHVRGATEVGDEMRSRDIEVGKVC